MLYSLLRKLGGVTHCRNEQVTVAQPVVTPAEGCPPAGLKKNNTSTPRLLPWIPIKGEFYHVPIPTISCKSGFLATFPPWLNVFASYTMCNRLVHTVHT